MSGARPQLPEGVEVIDVELFGARELSCSYLVHAAQPALIETGPSTVLDTLVRELGRRGIEPRHVIVTHIHLDHAGGAGHLSRAFPGATIWVHSVGAPHLADPTRLLASARRLYGEALESLWGPTDPVPPSRLRAMDEGTVIPLGDRELHVLYTPGHARHEVTLLEPDARVAFIGDTAGVLLGDGWSKPATPPPDFDLEAALASIERLKGLHCEALCFTHYGPAREPALDRAAADLRRWDAVLRPLVLRGASFEELEAAILPHTPPPPEGGGRGEAAETLSSLRNSLAGFVRWYRKRYLEPASP